ncbi:MAG TPA: OmpA family protein [Kofleriaceae bacterium]|nr:OmpA family protein [Kofleriaceae bacterium]
MANGAGKPKPAFFIAVVLVVAGLVGLAGYRYCGKKKTEEATPKVDPNILKNPNGSGGSGTAENPDPNAAPTTVTKYEYEPASTLPPVPGTANYKALGKPRVVRFAVNTWAGWAPIIWANNGHKAGKVWKDAKGQDFQVELVLADDPVAMGNTVANGDVQIGWATVDMLPLIIERLKKDPRTMPRVFQQIDWSNGGDGIVVRNSIKDVADLRGKTVVLAQNSPSHFFLLNVLLNGGVQPSEVKMKFTKDAFQAAAAFNQNPDIAACVSWAPDIYTLTENPKSGNKLLVTTGTANKLIADVWFARADFARDNPDIIEGLVRGILDAVTDLQSDQNKQKVGELMDKFYNLPPGTGSKMLGDAHWTNYAENRDFFLVSSNPTNFERTYGTAKRLYAAIKVVNQDVEFDKIMDFSVIKKLGNEAKYAEQKNTYEYSFTPKNAKDVNVESAILTKTVTINFFPNSFDVYKKVPAKSGGGEVYYDGNIEYTLEEIAKLAGQFGAARIVISGHTDSSMKGTADPALVKELSENRAKAVKEALLKKFPKLDPNQLIAAGYGWEKPADPNDPDNHAKNRRVEVKVVPAEAQ